MWRWVRDRPEGYAHAVPADFDARVWYAVCLDKVVSATARDANERGIRVCAFCRIIMHGLTIDDQYGVNSSEPTPDQLLTEYEDGASLNSLHRRYGISKRVLKLKLVLAGGVLRSRREALNLIAQLARGA